MGQFSPKTMKQYFLSRIPSLLVLPESDKSKLNPIHAFMAMSPRNWSFFWCAWLGWTFDSFDYFSVSVTASQIADTFGCSLKEITWGMTLVLMVRSVGAVIFGVASDRYGRKWPFIINCLLFIILELGTSFVSTYKQFLAVRALFGIALGGMFGNAAATAMEDAPLVSRGILSGLFQAGYAFGYLLAVIFNQAFENTPHGWRALFWFSSALPVIPISWRLLLPETDTFMAEKETKNENLTQDFIIQAKIAFKKEWLVIMFLVCYVGGFNYISHGSQDLYPAMLEKQLHFSEERTTVTMVVLTLGDCLAGLIGGHICELLGRRLTVVICCVCGGALIYPTFFIRNNGIYPAVFLYQFFVQCAWGIIPIYLNEMSPPAFRAVIAGTAYQLGNLAASAATTIETTVGERFPLNDEIEGTYDYGKVMAILCGAAFAYLLIMSILGPERYHNDFHTPEYYEFDATTEIKVEKVQDEKFFSNSSV
ncbi:unnamed protein product [Debaryomyces tyrocola]|nr:unnamed protein product [Debaryomyces tyrocola]